MISDEEYQKRVQDLKDKKFKSIYFIHIPKAAGSYVRKFSIPISCHGNHEQFHSNPPLELIKERKKNKPVKWSEKADKLEDPKKLIKEGKTVLGYKKINKELIQDSLKFATVRNPFDYLMSCYFSGMVGQKELCRHETEIHNRIKCELCECEGYETFLRRYAQGKRLYLQSRKNLFHQIFDDEGRCCVDLLIRSEFIVDGLKQLNSIVFDKNKIENISEKRVNTSRRRRNENYKKFYTEEIRSVVEKKVRNELDIFGYEFDGPVDRRPFIFLDRDRKYDIF